MCGIQLISVRFLRQKRNSGEKMTYSLNKKIKSRSKNWVTLINSEEMRQKRTFGPKNCNLYHYAGNNPVRYTDPDGRAPQNLTETQRTKYKNKVTSLKPSDIPNNHDCADTALYIYNKSYEAATGTVNGFKNVKKDGIKLDVLRNVQAKDLFGILNQSNKNINYYKSDGTGQSYDSSLADRSFNSSNVEIGTVGLYKPAPGEDGFSGHTITVTGVSRDTSGNVLSISYIEGHMNDVEQEEHTFTREAGANGSSSLHNRYLNCVFVGWGEFEP